MCLRASFQWQLTTRILKINKLCGPKTTFKYSHTMEVPSKLAYIENVPKDPVQMFSDLIEAKKAENPEAPFIPMNMATLDTEFGVLNRTLVYRGLTDRHVTFVTERNSRKYTNIMDNPKVSLTILLGSVNYQGSSSFWQVRVFGEAFELTPKQISNLWTEEPVFAKIRSRICECGKPVNHDELKEAHDTLLKAYSNGTDTLPQTATYTAFKIVPTIWDFYKSEVNNIADRVLYKKDQSEEGKWNTIHVAA